MGCWGEDALEDVQHVSPGHAQIDANAADPQHGHNFGDKRSELIEQNNFGGEPK